eukprot:2965091-Pyramimonas_sp.AAC.1
MPILAAIGFSVLRGNPPRDIASEGQQWPLRQQRFKATARPRRGILHACAARRLAGLTEQAGHRHWMDHPKEPLHQKNGAKFK